MGSKNSTDSGSCASDTGNGGKVSMFVRFATFIERILHKPITKASKKKIAMSATRRPTFVWNISRIIEEKRESDLARLFVRVIEPRVEVTKITIPTESVSVQSVIDTAAEEHQIITIREKDNVSSFLSKQMSHDLAFTSEVADKPHYTQSVFDVFGLDDSEEKTDVPEAADPVVVVNAEEYAVPEESEEEKEFYSGLYEDLAAEATIELMGALVPEVFHHPPEYVISEISDSEPAETMIDVPAGVASVFDEHIDTEEEKEFYSGLYEDLAAEATIELMGALVPEVFHHPPEYVISEISDSEPAETTIEIPVAVSEAVVSEKEVSHVTDFVFGFQTPKNIKRGSVSFSFSAGDADDDSDTECDNIRIVSHEMDSNAVSVSPYTL